MAQCPRGGIGIHSGLRNRANWLVGSSPTEGTNAEMAELVDAPASKAGVFIDVWVRVPLSVQNAGVIRCGNGVRLISE